MRFMLSRHVTNVDTELPLSCLVSSPRVRHRRRSSRSTSARRTPLDNHASNFYLATRHRTRGHTSGNDGDDNMPRADTDAAPADLELLRFRNVILLPPQQCFDQIDSLSYGDPLVSSSSSSSAAAAVRPLHPGQTKTPPRHTRASAHEPRHRSSGRSTDTATRMEQQQQQHSARPDSDYDAMLLPEHAWWGMISLTHPSSPWYRGCFAFTVSFPSRYPFECPLVEFDVPLRSHPLLTGQTKVELYEVYRHMDPMRVSVMARLLRHVTMLFYPQTWPASWWGSPRSAQLLQRQSRVEDAQNEKATSDVVVAPNESAAKSLPHRVVVDDALAQEDVRRRSITQEVVMGKPYDDLLRDDVAAYFLHNSAAAAADLCAGAWVGEEEEEDQPHDEEGVARRWSAWYARDILPRILRMP